MRPGEDEDVRSESGPPEPWRRRAFSYVYVLRSLKEPDRIRGLDKRSSPAATRKAWQSIFQNRTEGRYAPAGSLYSPELISVIG